MTVFRAIPRRTALDQHRVIFDQTCESGATHPDPDIAPKCSNNGSGDTAKTGPKHRVFDPFTGIWAKYCCFRPVSALFQPCPLSTNIRPKHAKRWCASGSGYRSEMLEQRIRGYSQNRPKTSVKQAFYREYSQNKVKYLLFWPYSSKNHSHSSKNRYRSFEHVSRRNGRIRVFGQNDPK